MNELLNTVISGLNSMGFWFVDHALAMFVQSSILIGLLLVFDLFLRRRMRAVFRYFIWLLVLIKLVLPSSLTSPASIGGLWGDLWQVESVVSVPVSPPTANISELIDPEVDFSPVETAVTNTPETSNESVPVIQAARNVLTPLTWQGLLFLVWYGGVFVFAVLVLQRLWFVRGLLRQGQEADPDLKELLEDCRLQIMLNQRNVDLKISPNMTSPAVCGLFRPTILLPNFLINKLNTEQLRAVLLHELAHIKRGDLLVNLTQTILQIVYFYNPLLWLANGIIRRVREQAVDETVLVALGKAAPDYSNTLIDIAELAFLRPSLALRLVGVVESKKALSQRIKHIVNRPIPKTAKLSLWGLIAVAITAVILLPMGAAETSGIRENNINIEIDQH